MDMHYYRLYINGLHKTYIGHENAMNAYRRAAAWAVLQGLDKFNVMLADWETGEVLEDTNSVSMD